MVVTPPAVALGEPPTVELGGDFDSFYRDQRQPTMRLAYLLCGDRHVAEEVAAEALARVYRAWRRVRIDNAEAYLRRTVVNEVRSRGRRRLLERREQQRRVPPPMGLAGSDRTADHHLLVAALVRLPVHQRAPIVLRYFEDLSETETARVLGCRVGTVKSSVSRGLVRLRELMGEESND
jgi:RNA polymerase sigma-70 factor (sigma-E family)